MPRKTNYVKENMHVAPHRVWYYAMKNIDWRQPIVIIGREKGTNQLYVASTDNGKMANSLMAKAMAWLKVNDKQKEKI